MTSAVPRAKLGDLFAFKNGRAFGRTEWSQGGLPIIRIQNLNDAGAGFNFFGGEYSKDILVRSGDLLFSWSGTIGSSFGPHLWTRGDGLLNQHIYKLCFKRPMDVRYAYYALEFITEEIEASVSGAVGLVHVTKGKLHNFSIPFPDVSEQARIVSILDETFEGVAIAKANAEKNLQNSRELLRRQLATSVAELVADQPMKSLESFCVSDRVITYGVIKLGEHISSGVPCLRTSNVRWLGIETEGMKKIDPALSREFSRTILRGGEVLVNVRGTLGGVAEVPFEMAGWNVSREVAVVPVAPSLLDPKFAALWVASEVSQAWLGSVKKGAAYTGINIEDLRRLPVPVLNLKAQLDFAAHLQEVKTQTEALQALCVRKLAALDELKQSLLHQAFSGAL